MSNAKILKRFNVATPAGVVHLVAFEKLNHRQAIIDILSEVSGTPLVLADIVQNEKNSRPEIPAIDFDVNWTHSRNVCVLAFGEPGTKLREEFCFTVGVDFEVHRPNRIHIADRFFSAEEVSYLKSMDPSLAQVEFFRLWCRKEALFKCAGGSFFEGSMRCSVLDDSVKVGPGQVYFVDLDGAGELDLDYRASLCVAVCLKRN